MQKIEVKTEIVSVPNQNSLMDYKIVEVNLHFFFLILTLVRC